MALNEFAPACSECDGVGRDATGRDIYPHRPDLYPKHFYRCDCGAYVGCHPGTVKALGTPAGAETRRARSQAHTAFDPIWKRGAMRRGDAYKALAAALGLSRADCHISWFGAEMCARIVDLAPTLRATTTQALASGDAQVASEVRQPIREGLKSGVSPTPETAGGAENPTGPAEVG